MFDLASLVSVGDLGYFCRRLSTTTMKAIFSLLVWSLISGAVYAQFPPCNICEEDGTVGNPDTVIPKGFANVLVQDMTCAEVQQMGADGVFNVLQCILLGQAGIVDSCGCGVVSTPVTPAPGTTEPPPSVPSLAPVAPVPITSGPTSVPIDLPTEATAVPTGTSVSNLKKTRCFLLNCCKTRTLTVLSISGNFQ